MREQRRIASLHDCELHDWPWYSFRVEACSGIDEGHLHEREFWLNSDLLLRNRAFPVNLALLAANQPLTEDGRLLLRGFHGFRAGWLVRLLLVTQLHRPFMRAVSGSV